MKVLLQAIRLLGFSILVWLSLTGWLNWKWKNRTLPQVYIGQIKVGNLSDKQIENFIQQLEQKCQMNVLKDKNHQIELKALKIDRSILKSSLEAGKGWAIVNNWGKKWILSPKLDEKSWQEIVNMASMQFKIEGQEPIWYQDRNQNWKIKNGSNGYQIDVSQLKSEILKSLENKNQCPKVIDVPWQQEQQRLTTEEIINLEAMAKQLAQKKVSLEVGKTTIVLSSQELVNFLEISPKQEEFGQLSKSKIETYLKSLKLKLDSQPEDARFTIKNNKVVEFSPAKSGYQLEVEKSAQLLINALTKPEKNQKIKLAVKVIKPKITIKDSNDLGIVELLGRGESFYRHSIPSRVYNVELASRKIDGVLIAPGEEFSFNQAVGEISKATGFKSAYIIKDGRTILGDGGGVCQVSTTVFRAALNAGLPITERWAHAYRVGYYEQNSKPGFDATVFAPNKDLKFKNDTGSYILLDSWYDDKERHLVVDLYGKNDGRKSIIKNIKVWDIVPPPPPIYQDDPSLPKGVVKQVDWKAWGAKAKFDYWVEKEGKVIFQKTFFSNYRPWQDVFLVGTKAN